MTTEVSNEMIEASIPAESSISDAKRKLEVSSSPEPSSASKPKLSHSVSFIGGIDDVDVSPKGREEYASDIPSNAVNLCSASFGARVLFATDEWFAKADNLLKDSPPEFDEDAYCEQGKVMDGWESRRRREEGHDWCLVQLGVPYWTSAAPLSASTPASKLQLVGIELDTAHFTGNHSPQVSIEMATTVENPISVIEGLPNGVQRLLSGGRQGTGHTPTEVEQAQKAIDGLEFTEILPRTPLQPGHEQTRYHYFPLDEPMSLQGTTGSDWAKAPTWVKLNYFPDGGVARMRFWATEVKEEEEQEAQEEPAAKKQKVTDTVSLYMPITTGPICTVVSHTTTTNSKEELPSIVAAKENLLEISSDVNGGKGVACSNKHYGEPWRLIQTTMGEGMWDGWETARHSHRPAVIQSCPKTKLMDTPLNDWAILKLGQTTSGVGIQKIILDTKHFLGNYPESILLEGCCHESSIEGDEESFWKSSSSSSKVKWFPLVSRTRMSPNAEHMFAKDQIQNAASPVTHVRLSTYPDGGCSRVRVYV
eukprot:CAMPEP_0113641030 /NCGR_PEP_ID=MMETSP0017_2-20120614/21539_1 /TAXON_ID=2856 /ORGANISM="Cylindrotheca closterium" /LENGTH=534 /DNA_ID=CAMNT_0000552351 /DNA_START=251 /DNA_END=1855 /DNA_ORIENTATION=+ /assembly_acc=CAM_ASM_000147